MNYSDPKEILADFSASLTERSEYEAEWQIITDWLLPGHGIYSYTTPPTKQDRTPSKIVNDKGREALRVMTAGLQSGATNPAKKWFKLGFTNPSLDRILPLRMWLDDCEKQIYSSLYNSNFYSVIHSSYIEFGGFGIACIYFGSDGDPFRFELSEIGTYSIAEGVDHKINKLYRIVFKSAANMVDMYGSDKVSDEVKRAADKNPDQLMPILHGVVPDKYQDKPFHSFYIEYNKPDAFLEQKGFYEFPFLVPRWEYKDGTPYCSGPGELAIPYIKRLQEMEKANLMAAHKAINPPLNAPARKKGTVRTLPGGINYYDNPQEVVTPMYNIKFDFAGVFQNIQRTELAIEKIFFNDLFITASRDPNLSPLKAAEVYQRRDEQMIRIGPTIEAMQVEMLDPLITRAMNVLGRAGKLPPFPMEFADMVSDYEIRYISPLAEAQKQLGLSPFTNFLQNAMGIIQLKPEASDKINGDRSIDELADITGAPAAMFNTDEEVKAIRDARAKQMAEEQAKQEAMAQQGLNLDEAKQKSEIAKNYAAAGVDVSTTMGGETIQ